MAGPGAATELPLQRGRHLDPGDLLHSLGVDHLQRWREQGIGASRSRQLPIPLQIPRVAIEILSRAELQWIHKHAHQQARPHTGPRLECPLQQLLMALMQGTHGGHEMQGSIARLTAPAVQLTGTAQHLHGHHKKSPAARLADGLSVEQPQG